VRNNEPATAGDLPRIGGPATRALNRLGVTAMRQLAGYSENQLLELHGFGPKAMKIIKAEMASRGMSLRKE